MIIPPTDENLPAPIGLGHYGSNQQTLTGDAEAYLSSRGLGERLLLVFNGGGVKAKDIDIPRINLSPKVLITTQAWHVLSRSCKKEYASGPVSELRWAETTSDGIAIRLSGDRSMRFFTTWVKNEALRNNVIAAIAHSRLEAARFNNDVPNQRPIIVNGTHYGGYGTDLSPDSPVVVALSGCGICAISPSGVLLKPTSAVRAVQVGGKGEYSTGGGWFGGGFGIRGALEGAALATVLNWFTTQRHMDSLLRLIFDDAEVTFGLETHAPGRLEIELSALLATLRGPNRRPAAGALDLKTLAERTDETLPAAASAGGAGTPDVRFCGHCGSPRSPQHDFCMSCGSRFP